MRVLVSACLLGVKCRYDGNGTTNKNILRLCDKVELIPVCPELLGGLGIPRAPTEIQHGHAVTKDGKDVTEAFLRGAEETLRIAKLFGCRFAVLQSRSPSCGLEKIYDGTFSGNMISGNGFTAELLKANGITVLGDGNTSELLK